VFFKLDFLGVGASFDDSILFILNWLCPVAEDV
jgi:hypothetical protein